MPDGDWLYLEGEVRHHSMKGFGVQFTELNEDQMNKLRWLLRIAQEAGPTDAAISADNPFLRIIHGKGTGAVRDRVHSVLKGDRRVSRYALAPANQGGSGATIVEFRS